MKDLTKYANYFQSIKIKPQTQEVLRKLQNDFDKKKMVMTIGDRNTGKTFIAAYYALLSILNPNTTILFVTANPIFSAQSLFLDLYHNFNHPNKPEQGKSSINSTGDDGRSWFKNDSSIYFFNGSSWSSVTKGMKSDITIFDDFDELNSKSSSGAETLLLTTSTKSMTYLTTCPFDISGNNRMSAIYHDLKDNIVYLGNKNHSYSIIKVYNKVEFDKEKTKLRAKSENEKEPMWLRHTKKETHSILVGVDQAIPGSDFSFMANPSSNPFKYKINGNARLTSDPIISNSGFNIMSGYRPQPYAHFYTT